MARAPKSVAGETPAKVMTDAECQALAHLGPLCLDPEVYAQVLAWKQRIGTPSEGRPRTIPGPLVTDAAVHAAHDAARAAAAAAAE